MPDWRNKDRPWAFACEIDLAIDLDVAPGPLDGRMQTGIHAHGAIRINPDDEDLEATWRLDLTATVQVSGAVAYVGTLQLDIVVGGALSDSGSWPITTDLTGGANVGSLVVAIPCQLIAREEGIPVEAGDTWEAPPRTKLSSLLSRTPGESYTATLTLLEQSVSVTHTPGSAAPLPDIIETDGQVWATRSYTNLADPPPGATSIQQSVRLVNDLGGSSVTGTHSHYATTGAVADAWSQPGASNGLELAAENSGFAGAVEASGSLTMRPDRPIVVDLALRALSAPYPDGLNVICDGMHDSGTVSLPVSGGELNHSYTQKSASGNGRASVGGITVGGGTIYTPTASDTDSYATDTRAPVRFAITTGSLIAMGDETRETDIHLLGWLYTALRLSQVASLTIDDGTSLTPSGAAWGGSWTGSGGASVSVASGAIRIAGGTGAVRAFSHAISLSGLPTLRVRVKADADDAPIRIQIGSKTWSRTLGLAGVYVDLDLDLSGEDNGGGVSSADTRWPVDVDDGLAKDEQSYFGIWRANEITVTGLDSGMVYDIDSLTLRRDHATLLDFLPAFYRGRAENDPVDSIDEDWPVKQREDYTVSESGTETKTWIRRSILARTRGVQTLEQGSDLLQRTTGGMSGVQTITNIVASIGDIADSVNETGPLGAVINPGWSATKLVEPDVSCPTTPDLALCRLTTDAPVAELMGAGLLWDGSGLGWRWFDDLSIASGATDLDVPAHFVFVELFDWVSDGDLFGHHPGADTPAQTIWLRGGAILRAAGHGEVLSGEGRLDGPAQSGGLDEVALTLSGSARGEGAITDDGIWRIDPPGPFAQTKAGNELTWGTRVSSGTGFGRTYRRAVFRDTDDEEEDTGEEVSIYRDASGQGFFYTVRQSDAALVVYRYHGQPNDPTTGQVFVIDSSGNAVNPCAFMFRQEVHYCAFRVGTTLNLAMSRDSGRSWTNVTIPGTCEKFRMCGHRDRIIVVKYKSTEWYVQVGTLDPSTGNISWSSEQALLAAGVGSSAGDVKARPDNVIEFGYVTPAGAPIMLHCNTLATDGTGAWH